MPVAKRTRPSPVSPARPAAAAEPLERRRLLSGTTYYVSTAGSDNNPGTDPTLPWATVAKVDATAFQPGDTVLFERGDQWRESLQASSDGAAGSPITYGAYGDATMAQPLFIGSDVLASSAFTLVPGTTSTYSAPDATAVHWVFYDGVFTHEAQDVLAQAQNANATDAATDINAVQTATQPTFFDDAATATLYVNIQTAVTPYLIETAVRDDAVLSFNHSYVTFDSLSVSETADDNAGYGIRVEQGHDDTVTNCDATEVGKHAVGAIDTTAFTASNLTATQAAPDQGYGGASGFVFFVDATDNGAYGSTAAFTGLTWSDRNGAYPIFDSHGTGTGAIASLTLTDLDSPEGYGGGFYVNSTGPAEVVTVTGGTINQAQCELDTDDSVVNGMTFTGYGAELNLVGSDDLVQNCVFADLQPNAQAGLPAAVVDQGTSNVVRFDTFDWTAATGAAVQVLSATAGTTLTGDVFDVPVPLNLDYDGGLGTVAPDYNLYAAGAVFQLGTTTQTTDTLATFKAAGLDTHSLAGDPDLADPATGDYSLLSNSLAVDLVPAAAVAAGSAVPITADAAGNPRPFGAAYDAGAYELQSAKAAVVGTFAVTAAAVPESVVGTASTATFLITLSAPATTAETVQYATADGTAAGGVDYTPASGTATFAPGTTTRSVRVAVNPVGANAGLTFTFGLLRPSSGTQVNPAAAAATAVLPVAPVLIVNEASRINGEYADGSARIVSARVKGPGDLTIYRSPLGGDPVEVVVTDATAATTVNLRPVGGVHTTIGSVYIDGGLGEFYAPLVTLTGNFTATGNVGRVLMNAVTGPADVTLAGKAHTSFAFGAVSDLSVTSASALGAITATSWAAPTYGTLTAPSIASLRVGGSFGPDVTLTGTQGDLPAAQLGAVTGGTWTVAGRTGTVAVRSTAAGWSATFAGRVGTFATGANLSGAIAAPAIGTLRVGRDLSSATVTLTGAAGRGYDLSSLRVGGTASASTVRSAGSVNAVTVGALSDTTVLVGVASTVTGLPTARADFASVARLNAFTVTGPGGTGAGVTASDVAAATVGRVRVDDVVTANAGVPFGFAVESLAAYTDVEAGKKTFVWTARDGAAALTTTGDYKVLFL